MSPIDKSLLAHLLANGPSKSLLSGKQLVLAFGGLYIASTTLHAKPLLVWEADSGYARYYIPIQSLHSDIKAALSGNASNGASKQAVGLKTEDEIKGDNDSAAVIETLTVGQKSTTWVRFTEGLLQGFIRFESKDMDALFENGALIQAIKNPFKRIDTKPIAAHILIKIGGETVAETSAPVILNETGLNDAYYLPATSIKDWGMLEKSALRTACPYKGEAWYYTVNVNGKKYENAIWYYPYPTHESSGVEGFFSFYNREGTEILVDGVKVMDMQDGGREAVVDGEGMRFALPRDGRLEFEVYK